MYVSACVCYECVCWCVLCVCAVCVLAHVLARVKDVVCVWVLVLCVQICSHGASVVHVCGGEVWGGCGGGVACSVCTGRQILFYKRE